MFVYYLYIINLILFFWELTFFIKNYEIPHLKINKNNVKFSYICMENIKTLINSHNKKK